MKRFFQFMIIFFPWRIRRVLLNKIYGYSIHKNAKIGYSWIYPKHLIMESGAKIGHLNVAIHLNEFCMKSNSKIGRLNWITGFPLQTNSKHFSHQPERNSKLYIGEHSSITKNHHLDCTNELIIGKYATIAGYHSQFLTHSINIMEGKQDSLPIEIGDYTFIGTNVVVLGGSKLPSYSVLGAKSLLNSKCTKEYFLYGGVPAKEIKEISKEAKYFNRTEGFVY